jgi:uncharacterized membrane protein YhaH (DUF805 family)
MKEVGAAFENFAFKAFDFNGRATRLEYWLIMPLLWGFIIFLFVGDVKEFWDFLLQRRVPPMNPLYWDSIVVFFLTLIPRMSLTVRRLHDSGKSGKWVKLPFTTVVTSFWLVLGLGIALLTLNGPGQEIGIMVLLMGVFGSSLLGSADISVWSALFSAAAAANAIGWDAIWEIMSNLMPAQADIDINRGVSNAAQSDPAMLMIGALIVSLPFITGFLHLFFMISPTLPDHALDRHGPISGASLRRQGDVSDNPFAGYKYLYPKSEEQEAAHKAAAKEEIRSLYQQRVLGQGQQQS